MICYDNDGCQLKLGKSSKLTSKKYAFFTVLPQKNFVFPVCLTAHSSLFVSSMHNNPLRPDFSLSCKDLLFFHTSFKLFWLWVTEHPWHCFKERWSEWCKHHEDTRAKFTVNKLHTFKWLCNSWKTTARQSLRKMTDVTLFCYDSYSRNKHFSTEKSWHTTPIVAALYRCVLFYRADKKTLYFDFTRLWLAQHQ